MTPQLAALFAQHKIAILGAGAAGAVLLGLRARKGSAGTPTTAGARVPQPAGTLPAAGVVPATGGIGATYDSTGSDIYALQDEIAQFLQQQGASTSASSQGAAAAVAPVASTLFSPTVSGQYGLYGNGTVAEIESDGSQLGLTYGQWNDLLGKGARVTQTLPVAAPAPSTAYYETAGNLANVQKPSG